jgi:hypothetical protein
LASYCVHADAWRMLIRRSPRRCWRDSGEIGLSAELPLFRRLCRSRRVHDGPVDRAIRRAAPRGEGAAHAYLGHVTMTTIAGQPAWHGGPDSHGNYGTLANPGVIDVEVYGDSIAQTDRIMTNILQPLSGNSQTTAA